MSHNMIIEGQTHRSHRQNMIGSLDRYLAVLHIGIFTFMFHLCMTDCVQTQAHTKTHTYIYIYIHTYLRYPHAQICVAPDRIVSEVHDYSDLMVPKTHPRDADENSVAVELWMIIVSSIEQPSEPVNQSLVIILKSVYSLPAHNKCEIL